MPNPFARFFSGDKTGKLENFPDFVSLLTRSWNADFTFTGLEVAEGTPPPEGEARLLLRGSDRPAAVVVGPAGASSSLDALASLTASALAFIEPGEGLPRAVAVPAAAVLPEQHDYRGFASEPRGWLLLFDDGVEAAFADLLESHSPRALAEAAQAALAAEAPPPAGIADPRITVTDPWSACASRLLFPPAVAAGETAIRFTPRSYGPIRTGGEAPYDAWFRFGVKTDSSPLGGFWAFRRPDSVPAERFPALAASVAKAAGSALSREYAAFSLPGAASAAAGAESPRLGAAPAFSLDGTVAVGAVLLETCIVVSPEYPLRLAALCGVSAPDAVNAMLAADRVLVARPGGDAMDGRALVFKPESARTEDATSGAPFLPFYEFLGMLSDLDYRKVAQNFLPRLGRREELSELFYYRKTLTADGAPKRLVVRPQAFDLGRFASTLPEAVREGFLAGVRENVSAPTAGAFLLRNEEAYEAAMAELRRGTLDLGYRGRSLLVSAYRRYVYPRMRKRLDTMIEADTPFATLRVLPPRLFRAAVDASDSRTIAAALVGRGEAIADVAAWCSRRKLAGIREELVRFEELLGRGEADIDELCALRAALVKKAEAAQAREREERSAGR